MIDISVVIPCYNGAATLPRQVHALAAQMDASRHEIVVADNMSTDDLSDVVARLQLHVTNLRIVPATSSRGVNAARNAGARAARGRFVLVCDADDVVCPGWLEAYEAAFLAGAHAVSGPMTYTRVDDDRIIGRRVGPFDKGAPVPRYAQGANCGFSREAFDEVDGFDESIKQGWDEVDFFHRLAKAGYQVRYVPDASIHYYLRQGGMNEVKAFFGYGRGFVRFRHKWSRLGQSFYHPWRWALEMAEVTLRLFVPPILAKRTPGGDGSQPWAVPLILNWQSAEPATPSALIPPILQRRARREAFLYCVLRLGRFYQLTKQRSEMKGMRPA
jgi:GT2 family glycosyltransferase